VEDVWKKERAQKEEEARVQELRREYEEERDREAMDDLQVRAGLKKHSGKLAWMYEGPAGARPEDAAEIDAREREAFLMGEKQVTELAALPPVRDSRDQGLVVAAEAAAGAAPGALSAHEQFVRLHEDPLFAIRKRQLELNPAAAMQSLSRRARSPSRSSSGSSSESSRRARKQRRKEKRQEKKERKRAKKDRQAKQGDDHGSNGGGGLGAAAAAAPAAAKDPKYGLQLSSRSTSGANPAPAATSHQAPAAAHLGPTPDMVAKRAQQQQRPPTAAAGVAAPALSREEQLQAMAQAAKQRDEERAREAAARTAFSGQDAAPTEEGVANFSMNASKVLLTRQPLSRKARLDQENDDD
jgi:hypothetical protein